MNEYLNCGCCETRRTARRCCFSLDGAICFFGFLIALALGLILGAIFYETILPALAAIIAFGAALLAVVIALLVFRSRRCDCA